MKKYLLLLCLLLTQLTATAYVFEVDGIYYKWLSDSTVEVVREPNHLFSGENLSIPAEIENNRYRVISIGERAFDGCSQLLSVKIPSSVSMINKSAFANCHKLHSVILEDGEEPLWISDDSRLRTFEGAPIDTLYLGRNVEYDYDLSPFKEKTELVSLTIGKKVTKIGGSAFQYCSGLRTLTIPENVETIHGFAFSGCSITKLTISDSESSLYFGPYMNMHAFACPIQELYIGRNLIIPDSPFSSSIASLTVSDKVSKLPPKLFKDCIRLKSFTIEDSDEELVIDNVFEGSFWPRQIYLGRNVSTYAFANDIGLKELTIGSKVTKIEATSLSKTSLKKLTIADSDTPLEFYDSESNKTFGESPLDTLYLGRNVSYKYHLDWYSPFKNRKDLVALTIGNKVTEINEQLFYECTGLTAVTIPEGVTTINSGAFSGCSKLTSIDIPTSVTRLYLNGCTGLTSFTIPSTATDFSFSYCTALNTIIIEDGVTLIPNGAFYKCINLSDITLPKSLTHIDNTAFQNCSSLSAIVIPKNVAYIGGFAFYNCQALSEISSLNPKPATIGNYAFDYVDKTTCVLHVPYGSKASYANASGWDKFKNIQEIIVKANSVVISTTDDCTLLHDGQTLQLTAKVLPDDTFDKTVLWTSSNDEMATVDDNGLVTAHAIVGEVVITATCGDVSGTIELTVAPTLVNEIVLNHTSAELKATETIVLNATITPNTATSKGVIWTSSNLDVATIDENGLVTAVGVGSTLITATAMDESGVTATCRVDVLPTTAESVTIEVWGPTWLSEGQCTHLIAHVLPETTTFKYVTWTSSDEQIATVDEDGMVTPQSKRGRVVITATCGEVSASVEIVVVNELTFEVDGITYETIPGSPNGTYVTGVSANNTTQSIVIPEQVEYDGEEYVVVDIGMEAFSFHDWLTSVSLPSTLKRISAGAFSNCKSLTSINIPEGVEIGIGAFSGCENLATVTLPQSLHTIERSVFQNCTALRTIVIPKNVNLIYNFAFYGCTNLRRIYVESLVPPSCELALDMPTPVFFSADTYNNCTLFVPTESVNAYAATHIWQDFSHIQPLPDLSVPMESIEIYHEGLALEVGKEIQLTAIALPENASDKSIMWESSDHTVATISDDGIVTAIGEGEAIITASSLHNPAVNDTCKVTVEQSTGVTSIENDGIKLYTVDQNLVVEGTKDKVEIVTLEGKCVYDGYSRKIELAKGLYIVKVGKHVTKIAI